MVTSFSSAYAMDFGELISVEDKVIPSGENATITQRIDARTDTEGEVAFPAYKNSQIENVDVLGGTLLKEPEERKIGDKKYYVIAFDEKESEVSFIVTLSQEGTYEGDEADLGDTFPKDVVEIEYKAVNTSPLNIGKYSAQIAVPEGKQLLNIIGYNAKKPYSIIKADGYIFGKYDFGSIDAGEEVKLAINIYNQSNKSVIGVWVSIIIISIFFMFKNRYLLFKVKE